MRLFTFYVGLLNASRIIASLIFETECVCCGKITNGLVLCKICKQKTLDCTLYATQKICAKCGKLLISEIDFCTDCRSQNVLHDVDRVLPLYPYRFWAKELLFAWKMQNNRSLSPLFAAALYKCYCKHFSGIPIVPVPPRPNKIKEKGWDQIAELAWILRVMYKIPQLDLLQRTQKIQQKKLNRAERLQNSNQFVLKKRIKAHIPPCVLILDDIMTTGATLQKCAAALKKAGVKTVFALTLFIVE